MTMPEKEPGFWVALLAWIRGHQADFGYASLAALFSLLRNAWGKHAWSRRLLDALSCSTLAFFSQPLLMMVEGLFHGTLPASAPQVLAIYIGYVGTDYLRARLQSWTERKNGESR
ncbi:phage holin, lambda family [Candidatus Hamiltonella defensa]|nr:phage holin, lambda family [Candidatus Hamiltonella defensa]ASV34322.1 phage holin, lambda family [Candidatus Hamiltonella defensa]ASV34412.1 phage holin, lambda family [Candidatus Hamiltonella defensa]AWK17279.1 phage holin, lambda family [Candidatus Hamiltonella defensa]AWK17366.1 phage holin, lambda family [Candidatus Hamiltonella defensa]MBK4362146.1 phage holin, lambda family [Candidatus Hamiltonella defensa]